MKNEVLKEYVKGAYEAADALQATDQFKLEAFKIVLTRLLNEPTEHAAFNANATGNSRSESGPTAAARDESEVPEWVRQIALRLNLSSEQVQNIYHQDDDGTLHLILNNLPSSSQQATQDIAMLLTAGRVAAKKDESSTSTDIIRDEVDYYGKLDKSNFTRALNKLKPSFNFDTRNKALAPRAPGFVQAGVTAQKYSAAIENKG